MDRDPRGSETAAARRYQSEIDAILGRRHDNGGDHWATAANGLLKGSPFTTLNCAYLLHELGMDPDEPVLRDTADLILRTWREDGRFRLTPQGSIYPCHTINAVRTLAHLGYASDARVRTSFDHLLAIQHVDGGWRCAKFSYGRGPETDFANPGPTLAALDAFRFRDSQDGRVDPAVEFLLSHWTTRAPLGPCHFGIGTLFMQVTYPFAAYNLFFYVYVLSFYDRARADRRFRAALRSLESKLVDGKVVVERPHQKLATFACCRRGEPSELATKRYKEILANLA